jgi:hypothetical protein
MKYLELKSQFGGQNEIVRLKTNNDMSIDSNLFDNMSLWILRSLREIMGIKENRQSIILDFIKNQNIQNVFQEIHLTDPFRTDDKTVFELCDSIIKTPNTDINKIFIFTGTNLPDQTTFETHYNTFIVNNITKKVFIIDPAAKFNKRKEFRKGIYTPYIGYTVQKYFKSKGYNANFVQLSNPAQTNYKDVFCQTWSVLILLLFLKKIAETNSYNNIIIDVPNNDNDKHKLLFDFYIQILNKFPDMSKELNMIYDKNVKTTIVKEYKDEKNRYNHYIKNKTLSAEPVQKPPTEKDFNDNIKILQSIDAVYTFINFMKPDDIDDEGPI